MAKSLTNIDFTALSKVAVKAALLAGKVIQNYMDDDFAILENKTGDSVASQVLTEVDLKSEQTILSHLLPTCKAYNLGLLTEEQEDDKSRFDKDFFWCIDPLDGTLAFINKYPGFAVSIALVAKDGTPKIGVVYNPSTKTLYHAIHSKGAFKNGKPWMISSRNNYLTYLTDKKLSDTRNKDKIITILDEKVTDLGLSEWKEISGSGAVLNAILVVENAPAIMLKFPKKEKGGGSIWDYAATTCICNEMNVQATNFAGNKLDLNRKINSFMNHEGVYFSNLGG